MQARIVDFTLYSLFPDPMSLLRTPERCRSGVHRHTFSSGLDFPHFGGRCPISLARRPSSREAREVATSHKRSVRLRPGFTTLGLPAIRFLPRRQSPFAADRRKPGDDDSPKAPLLVYRGIQLHSADSPEEDGEACCDHRKRDGSGFVVGVLGNEFAFECISRRGGQRKKSEGDNVQLTVSSRLRCNVSVRPSRIKSRGDRAGSTTIV
jgi:hypothetical protein